MNYLNLSFHDLMQVPAFAIAVKANDKEATDAILWEAGMNTKEDYELVKCLHRALTTNTPVDDYLVMGMGRTDKEHIDSGFARVEDVIASSKSVFLREELHKLKPQTSVMEEVGYSSNIAVEGIDLSDDPVVDEEVEDMVFSFLGEEGDCV